MGGGWQRLKQLHTSRISKAWCTNFFPPWGRGVKPQVNILFLYPLRIFWNTGFLPVGTVLEKATFKLQKNFDFLVTTHGVSLAKFWNSRNLPESFFPPPSRFSTRKMWAFRLLKDIVGIKKTTGSLQPWRRETASKQNPVIWYLCPEPLQKLDVKYINRFSIPKSYLRPHSLSPAWSGFALCWFFFFFVNILESICSLKQISTKQKQDQKTVHIFSSRICYYCQT